MSIRSLLNLANKIGTSKELIVLAACDCARTVLHLVLKGEERPRLAIEAAERWAQSPTEENRQKAKQAAYAAYAAYAAAYAAYAAAAAAADAATYAAAAAAYAAHTIARASKDYIKAYEEHLKVCCDLIMKRIPRLENLTLLLADENK